MHGKDYNALDVEVHGGLTYAGECSGSICHVPKPGEPDNVFWFGFDCAHAYDLSPATQAFYRERGISLSRDGDDVYRTVEQPPAERQSGWPSSSPRWRRSFPASSNGGASAPRPPVPLLVFPRWAGCFVGVWRFLGREARPAHDGACRPFQEAAIAVAVSQIGVHEQGGQNRGPEVDEYVRSVGLDPAGGYSWCAAWVFWVFKQAAAQLGLVNPCPRTAGAVKLWTLTEPICRDLVPAPGAIYVLDHEGGKGHAGIIESIGEDGTITWSAAEIRTRRDPGKATQ